MRSPVVHAETREIILGDLDGNYSLFLGGRILCGPALEKNYISNLFSHYERQSLLERIHITATEGS